ncbi:DUF2304 family protein [Lachnospiraceae bacterium 42-17]|jgi:hypothetical protein|nr:DUF2304 domain-containing protein [Dorea sp.]
MNSEVIRIVIIIAGILLMSVSFLMHSYKKITVNFTVMWELLGIMLVLIGAVPVFSQWTKQLASGTGFAFFCVGAIFLFEEFRSSVMLSQLFLKTQEMAMHISMLNQENERIMRDLEKLECLLEEKHEKKEKKDTVCS